MSEVFRIFVEKKEGFDIEAGGLLHDLRQFLNIVGLHRVRILHRYDVEGISREQFRQACWVVFAEPPMDTVYEEEFPQPAGVRILATEYHPGQYDQRADSAAQCLQILTQGPRPEVRVARILVLEGDLTETEYERIGAYCLNPLESQMARPEKPATLEMPVVPAADVRILEGFRSATSENLHRLREELGLAMSPADLESCQRYFRDTEGRDPSLTEIRVLDTYWSDHCRHTTFLSRIREVRIESSPLLEPLQDSYRHMTKALSQYNGGNQGDVSLMQIATLAMKELRQEGRLGDLDASEEINACSIRIEADVDGRKEPWLVMFKNETHNHPTEIEPFGGAATCLGGAIRDPLSGRSYVYHAMRVTGSGDPRLAVEETLPGKLPQSRITRGAAAGFSSYGNQIGLATGQVTEIYDPGYIAKRMEIGAVIGAAPAENVRRQRPAPGDPVILLGGRTGRDGCGGATGSSKAHTEESLSTCGAEVQKGNPTTERKLQRLFRIPQISRMIKRCNDFGAGGVAVAIGELTEGLEIDLDAVPKKYEGLDGTELAISESQERMAVVVSPEDLPAFLSAAEDENLEACIVARVTSDHRLKMFWRGKTIVDIDRAFLDTHGVRQEASVRVLAPRAEENYFRAIPGEIKTGLQTGQLREAWLKNLGRLGVCGQKGLVERFDSTIGAGSVLLPFGGAQQRTPTEGMAAKLPLPDGETATATLMSFGYDPGLARWSPFHGAVFAVVEAVTKIAAMGGDPSRVRLSLQEYFEKPGDNPTAWGKPFAALLGAYLAQKELGIAAIGGKDSMSGTFHDLHVPPTLVAFALTTTEASRVLSPEFKQPDHVVLWLSLERNAQEMPDWRQFRQNLQVLQFWIGEGKVCAAHSVRSGGIAEAVSKMCFGNHLGFRFEAAIAPEELFRADFGSLVLEVSGQTDWQDMISQLTAAKKLGVTCSDPAIFHAAATIPLDEALSSWMAPLQEIFPWRTDPPTTKTETFTWRERTRSQPRSSPVRPQIFMPVFPGTNCEIDTARAFERAGGKVGVLVFRNLSPAAIEESLEAMVRGIDQAQIVMLPGGFSAGDEPEGSGKFIGAVFRNSRIRDAVHRLLRERDGLMLGICNGFQALIKLGLLPYGEIRDLLPDDPTLTYNAIGRHVSCMVHTRICSTISPWLWKRQVGDIHAIPVSHGEGRFVANASWIQRLADRGQIATQYVDLEGQATMDSLFNPNGSVAAIEGITSPDGRVFGKMGHSERIGRYVAKNVPGEKDQQIFQAGVEYFL